MDGFGDGIVTPGVVQVAAALFFLAMFRTARPDSWSYCCNDIRFSNAPDVANMCMPTAIQALIKLHFARTANRR